MAQAASAVHQLRSGGLARAELTDRELFEIQQYEKIIQFRDAIISGKHPTLRVPSGSNVPSLQNPVLEAAAGAKGLRKENVAVLSSSTVPPPPSQPKMTNAASIQKSEDPSKAELRTQRARLESAIEEEVEHRRAAKSSQAEPSFDLDISDVLTKALALVQSNPAPLAVADESAANVQSPVDSLDDGTFYSSRHDTPESHLTSRIQDQAENLRSTNSTVHESSSQQVRKPSPAPKAQSTTTSTVTSRTAGPVANVPRMDETNKHGATKSAQTSQVTIVPGLNNYDPRKAAPTEPSQSTSGAPSQDSSYVDMESTKSHVPSSRTRQPSDVYIDSHPPSPLIRNHTLQPIAPQPTQPTSLGALDLTSSTRQELPSNVTSQRGAVGTSAQVAALRVEQNVIASPDSSSQGGKKKGKKKKRRVDRQGPDPDATAFVKPEPQSPSPLMAPDYLRPSKRQRRIQGTSTVPDYEARFASANAQGAPVEYVTDSYRQEALPVGYSRSGAYPQRTYSSTITGPVRADNAAHFDGRQIPSEDLLQRQRGDNPTTYYSTGAVPASRPVPRAVSQVILTEPHAGSSHSHHEHHEGPRMNGHPDAEAFMVPPRPTPARIVVDAYGREYIDPPHYPHPYPRLSVVSSARHGEHEVVYERLPSRALSRQPVPGPYEEGGMMYAAPSPAYAMPRRVVTQPEYPPHDYRELHQREVSSRSIPPQGEYVQVVSSQERRYVEDAYGSRPTSVRPVESARYQPPADYGRVHSVRPETHRPLEFRGSAHPESRREALQPYMREYHPLQAPDPAIQRGFSVRPADHPVVRQSRGVEEIAFIERPRAATQEIVYADDARRQVYR